MIFHPDLAAKVLDGTKTQTRRPLSSPSSAGCRYVVGQTYAVQPGRGKHALGRIRVLSTERVSTFPISWDDARAEGFDSPVAFESKWIELYGPSGPGHCWRIEFELVEASA